MSAPRKFDEETRARAVRLYQDRLRDHGESKLAARKTSAPRVRPAQGRQARLMTRPSCGGCVRRTPSCGGRMRS